LDLDLDCQSHICDGFGLDCQSKKIGLSNTLLANMYTRKSKSSYRDKRSFEFIGNLISKLFGNPGPEDWKQNKRNVLAMKEAIERQMANSLIQHHDIDQNRHAINMQNEILRQTTNAVINNENRLNIVSNALTEFETYIELEMMFDLIFTILEAMKDIKHDAKAGRCNLDGLNKEFLIDHLRIIESNKMGIAPVFASWEWHSYYNYEMCTVAMKDESLWITMRIPIINLAERMLRSIPTSSQLWIGNTLSSLGFDSMLFKLELSETYMVTTKVNIGFCSLLGTTRVCNMRKTRFRESNNYLVPVDVGHDRVIIITNNTAMNYSMTSLCKTDQKIVSMTGHSMLRTPADCVVMSKTFEIGKKESNIELQTTQSYEVIESATFHRLVTTKSNVHSNMIKNIYMDNTTYEKNNNETLQRLRSVKFDEHWSSKPWFFTTTSSLSTILVMSIILIIACKCRRDRVRGAKHIKIELNEKNVNDKFLCSNSDVNHSPNCVLNPIATSDDSIKTETAENVEDKKVGDIRKELFTNRPMCQFRHQNANVT